MPDHRIEPFDSSSKDEWVAYHEAGHCVMSVLLGGEVIMATVDPEQVDDLNIRMGLVKVKWPGRTPSFARAMVYLAGPAAELVYRGESLHPGLLPEFHEDWVMAWTSFGRHLPEPERLKIMEAVAYQLFQYFNQDETWNAVSEIADMLLAYDTIEGDEIEEAIGRWLKV